ncbi:MAG: FAD-binding protein, partial [Clostridia bacterium]|nr:FAD-binding protein [Clostridia bacterium]
MQKTEMDLNGMKIPCVTLSALVVGTGAAGYNAALRLRENGAEDIAVVTEGVCAGTSRNTGSDKQTYYKLSLSGDAPDSPFAMAKDFFGGKCVDGDPAYAEAALSVPSFSHLVSLGVPFPTTRYGEYVGYQTDHDRGARATSAGPLTSRLMTECLQKEAERQHIPVFDGYTAVRVLKQDGDAVGLLCYNGNPEGKEKPFTVFITPNIIFATGGPAGAYADTVYPVGHHGASGVLFEAGVKGKNLTEWQYGLASVSPRWNV